MALSALLESDEVFDEALEVGRVSQFPRVEYSFDEVAEAGAVIAGELPWSGQAEPWLAKAFQVANNWRDAHAFPMRSVRRKSIFLMKKHAIEGVTAGRIKRMPAIRKKLRRLTRLKLQELQDLGGCRIVVDSIADARQVVSILKEESGHILHNQDDYIARPKKDGYRSHHLIFNYQGRAAASIFNGRRIEVQVRTRLQHSWATAVEAVGMYREEDLKSEKTGSADWLRLFQLMSVEIAKVEGCPDSALAPSQEDRLKEIRELNRTLDAVATLDNISHFVRWEETEVQAPHKPDYYLISYENSTGQVEIRPYFDSKVAVTSYDLAERPDIRSGLESKNIVLVEAGRLANLRTAYPNYFGDVQLFKENLKAIIGGSAVTEYKLKPQERVRAAARQIAESFAWMRRSRFRRPGL